jgi:hypothetical protein
MYEYVGKVFSAWSVHFETVSFIHLCSNSDRERPVLWNHSVGFPVRAYTADPAQDLMIIVQDSPEG